MCRVWGINWKAILHAGDQLVHSLIHRTVDLLIHKLCQALHVESVYSTRENDEECGEQWAVRFGATKQSRRTKGREVGRNKSSKLGLQLGNAERSVTYLQTAAQDDMSPYA